MGTFLHRLMEGLRGREQFMEGKDASMPTAIRESDTYMKEYKALQSDLEAFREKVAGLQEKGGDYDEHFERKIEDDHRALEVRIDTWARSWTDSGATH